MHFGKVTHYHTPRNEKATNADVPTWGGAVVVHPVTGKLLSRSQKKISQAKTGIEWGTKSPEIQWTSISFE